MEIKGTAVLAIREFVKKKFSSDYDTWMDALSSDAAKIYSGVIDSTGWYPILPGAKEPTEKIAKLFFGGNIEIGAKEAGRYSAEAALTGIYKIFVMAANPTYIIKRASRVFATYYRPCEMTVIKEEAKQVVIEISKLSQRYIAIENRIVGWCERALEISGCQSVVITASEVREEDDGKVVEINMKWD